MKINRILSLFVLIVAMATQAQVMQLPPIPADPDVRTGKLANGLTYYIRHNN